MTNPASTRRGPQPAGVETPQPRAARRSLARALPLMSCLLACVLLGAAAAADGGAAALVLAAWVLLLAVVGMRMTTAARPPARPLELVLAELDEDGGIGEPNVLRLVATPAASVVVRMRPRG
jgi:multisubunit Na+/H+ antiporter MnhB subunit